MLYIITPCFRPHNLATISNSIPSETKWIIVHHKKQILKDTKALFIKCASNNMYDMLNHVLDTFTFKDDDKITYLLDNNIMHRNFYSTVSNDLSVDFSIMQWGQLLKDNSIRLPPLPYCIPGTIDVSSFLVSYKYNKDVRFDNSENAFVNYAMRCFSNGPLLMINNYISYYKYLGE